MLLFGYENLDKERLDRVDLHSMYPRGQGRTFKFMMHMLSCAHVCEDSSRYLYIGENLYWSKDMARSFYIVLQKEGFEVEYRDDRSHIHIHQPQIDFWFGPPTSTRRFIEGPRWTDIFVDLTDHSRNRFHRELHELSYKVE